MSHICMRHATHMNVSRHTCEFVMVSIRMSHVMHMSHVAAMSLASLLPRRYKCVKLHV